MPTTRAFFFGPAKRRLFGVYHPPLHEDTEGGPPRAVLLCYPAPQEYMPTHWAFRRLALMLAKASMHVLRFDYFGTGDSAGDETQASLELWQHDVLTAAQELRRLSGARQISGVGMRLGAALLTRASQHEKLRRAVLWEPLVRGTEYLNELRVADALYAARVRYAPPLATQVTTVHELCGFPISASMYAALEQIDMLREPPPQAIHTHMLVAEEKRHLLALRDHLRLRLKRCHYRHVPEPRSAENLLSSRILQAIAAALSPPREVGQEQRESVP